MRSREERDALVLQWRHLPLHVAKRLQHVKAIRDVGILEAEAEGFVALIRAAELWEEGRGIKFVSYAYRSICNHLVRTSQRLACGVTVAYKTLRDPEKTGRITVKSRDELMAEGRRRGMDAEADVVFRDDRPESAYDRTEERAAKVRRALAQLTDVEQQIFRERFWKGRTAKDACARAGLGRFKGEAVMQRAAAKLRRLVGEEV